MELRKRSLNKDDQSFPPKSPLKKLKKDFSQQQSHIEDLCGEIWFEIFIYFDGYSLIHSFSNLNSSIDSLLSDYRLPIHYNVFNSNFHLPTPLNYNQIVSLHIDYSSINKNYLIDLNLFVRLRSLSLFYINEEQLVKLTENPLTNLCQISVRSKLTKFLLKFILIYFPQVKRVKLNSMGKEYLLKSFPHNPIPNTIEYLTLQGRIKLAKLFRLWPHVPNLHSFSMLDEGIHQCDYWIDEKLISRQNFPQNLSILHLTIGDDDLSFCNFERLIPKTTRYLTVSGSIADDDFAEYLSSNNWIRLMSNCSSGLQRIKLDLTSYFDPNDSSGLQKTLLKFRKNPFFRHTTIQSKNFFLTLKGFLIMEGNTIETKSNSSEHETKQLKRPNGNKSDLNGTNKRIRLENMVFYDRKRHPAALLHELHPEISFDKYVFEQEETPTKRPRFRCLLTIDTDVSDPIRIIGFGKSKQSAKNMAAQRALIQLYPTYRPPAEEILTEDVDIHQQKRFVTTNPLSLENDPTILLDCIRKHLTVKSIAIKTPIQLFHELFINNSRLNSSTSSKNRIELIQNDEQLVLVRVTAMDQEFWSVNSSKSVAQNDACQLAIESICNISFRQAKDEFIRAFRSLNKITLPTEIPMDTTNNNLIEEGLSSTTELADLPDVSSSFSQPPDEN
ncbi:unnamed protein product [Adineta ricciae]|uniref:DRBM domain-containing protein n=1 Tax=Adineta ricciae TaxID=249248 RepID=A0A814K153_ADIRI|nr:unnamed protein product [Adineta ricciae]